MRHRAVTIGAIVASVLGVGLEAIGPLLTKAAVDGAVVGETAVLVPVVLGFARAGRRPVRLGVPAPLPGRPDGAGRAARPAPPGVRRGAADGRRAAGPLRTGQVASRAITDLQLVQGLLSIVPLSAGTVVAGGRVGVGDALAVPAAHRGLAGHAAAGRGDHRPQARRTLFPATWSAQQRAAEIAQQVEETVTGVRVVKGFGQESREVAGLEGRARRLYAERLRAAEPHRAAEPGAAGAARRWARSR